MKKTIISVLLLSVWGLKAQNITTDMLRSFDQEVGHTATDKALINAITGSDLKTLALNRNNIATNDHAFKYKVDVNGITNQKSSGRCWMFTSLNILRPKVMEKYNLSSFEFSTNYLYFYDLLEKSNLFYEQVILTRKIKMNEDIGPYVAKMGKKESGQTVTYLFKNPIGDGGVWNSFVNLAEKYGVVPKKVMPETFHSEKTSDLNKLLRRKLREDGLRLREADNDKAARELKQDMLKNIYRILTLTLGQPPKSFDWRYTDKEGNLSENKNYTPVEFYNEVVGVELDDYIMLMNDPSRPYYIHYEISYDRNVMEGRNWKYVNLPAEEVKKIALASIKANEALYASCDVGKQLNNKEGLCALDNYQYGQLLGVTFGMDKKERIMTGESGSSHGMALIAVDVDKNEETTMWQFENSWGTEAGHNGYLTFTDDWFTEYMFRVVPHKKFISEDILKILDTEATLLPPWDPMFQMDE
ncbi:MULTISPECIES: C1 family peptidase [unclassified Saccharicrinis]|uniref:aminopeptidase C n=1 Tax=unclassified Saccharicrinis TaxID=2646859 RepID=UPI003D32B3F3